MYDELVRAKETVGFSPEENGFMHALLAAIVHLSNVQFDKGADDQACLQPGCKGEAALHHAADLLQIGISQLSEAMLANHTVTRGEQIRRVYTPDQAYDVRDALAKSLYGSLFGWIVARTNEMLAPELQQQELSGGRPGKALSAKPAYEIGVLDIFGFENFNSNSFEQVPSYVILFICLFFPLSFLSFCFLFPSFLRLLSKLLKKNRPLTR